MKSRGIAVAPEAGLLLQSKYDLDQLLADSSKIAVLPVESLPEVLAQVVSRIGQLKQFEGTLLSILFRHRTMGSRTEADDARLLSAQEVAKLFDVPESWVREQARAGNLPAIRLGHYVRFQPQEIARFVANRRSKAA